MGQNWSLASWKIICTSHVATLIVFIQGYLLFLKYIDITFTFVWKQNLNVKQKQKIKSNFFLSLSEILQELNVTLVKE